MNSPVTIEYDPSIREMIKDYVLLGHKESQRILGRSALYFPIFEHYLKVYRLPEQLKFLPIVESRLSPDALSSAGAAGLWQFTQGTAQQFHLVVNDQIDERRDPIRATEAAVQYLADLYGKYRDWALVLAAYNCGPARLNQAIRMAGEKDYWKVRAYLPKESQEYVPRFIAASYLMHYYHDHELIPVYPSHELQLTRTVKVNDSMNFQEIASITGVSAEVITHLNPGYRRGIIPASTNGHYLILPEAGIAAFRKMYHNAQPVAVSSNTLNGMKRTHIVKVGETLESVASIFKCNVAELKSWNNITGEHLYFRQELVIYASAQNNWKS
ncbi:MAG: transglycosylase SLT domain-containing protein [Saprospiraceae bacterium]|nr:transglycosylase SLT domain-containing protein [Saprospiraceae bacterium]